jgi:cobalamin biosynthetic protein CobC
MLEHGGRLRLAAARWGIPLADWIDLSTGINPEAYPVPALPADCWRRLPEDNDGLEAAAAAYYGNPNLLALPGSQAAIQILPALLPRAVAACLSPIYEEHPYAWERAGHKLRRLQSATLPRALATATPNVLLCNPNNPTARLFTREALLDAAAQLNKRGGTLVVDEAFGDPTPEQCVADVAGTDAAPNLIVLRSLGKFFGLAGARVGFLFAQPELLARMAEAIGPWAVSGPARAVAAAALADTQWQAGARAHLVAASSRLAQVLAPLGEGTTTALFHWLPCADAVALHDFLAQRGLLVRLFSDLPGIRIGLPATETEWQRLVAAIEQWKTKTP